MIDYVLNVAVAISAGIGALVSAIPSLHPSILPLCLLVLCFLTLINLRGVCEAGLAFVLPTYLFVGCWGAVLGLGLLATLRSRGHPLPVVAPPPLPPPTQTASLWLLMRVFASGCTALTGIEAVSNGMSVFRTPAVRNARRTLTAIIMILLVLLAGVAMLVPAYQIGATNPETRGYQSVLSQLAGAVLGRTWAYYLTMGTTLTVLALSANTSFAGFPQLCQVLAQDDVLPRAFGSRGRRLVFSLGIVVLAGVSALILVLFGGITDRLIPLFAVGAFGAFTASQLGMVAYWGRTRGRAWRLKRWINGLGALTTGLTLLVVLVSKFVDGAWITLLLIPGLIVLFLVVRRHYHQVDQELACDLPLELAELSQPIVVVPIKGWDHLTRKGLRFALKLSSEVYAIHIVTEAASDLPARWPALVEAPARAAGRPAPQLLVIESPYRQLMHPLLGAMEQLKAAHPERQLAVIIPDLVERRWYHALLHNHQADILRTLLLLRSDQRVVVVSVPWYLRA